jgi:hypothetical protein
MIIEPDDEQFFFSSYPRIRYHGDSGHRGVKGRHADRTEGTPTMEMIGGGGARKYKINPPKPCNLDCGHVIYFRELMPQIGEQLWCIKCRAYRICVGP